MADSYTTIRTLTSKEIARFWSKVKIGLPGECWPWLRGKLTGGYGAFNISSYKQYKNYAANRVAYFIHNSADPGDLMVCHSCDNPPCCNPAHLFLGTSQDNHADMVKKRRIPHGDNHYARTQPERLNRGDSHYLKLHPELVRRGVDNNNAKLTEDKVTEIRNLHREQGTTRHQLAEMYGVKAYTIRDVLFRRTWKHVP